MPTRVLYSPNRIATVHHTIKPLSAATETQTTNIASDEIYLYMVLVTNQEPINSNSVYYHAD